MTKKTTVILPTPGQFRRTIRKDGKPVLDEAGNPRVLTFNSRQPVELTAEELEAVRDDIGNVLHIATEESKPGKPAVKIDGQATAEFVKETKELRAKQADKKAKAEARQDAAEAGERPGPLAARRETHEGPRKDAETKSK